MAGPRNVITYSGQDIGGFSAGADLDDYQFQAVRLDATTSEVELLDAASDTVFGILQDKPLDTQAAAVRISGVTKFVGNGAIPVGPKPSLPP